MAATEKLNRQYLTAPSGEKVGVVIPQQFNELPEDLEDLAAIAERREEPTLSHKQVLEELKRDGDSSDRS